MCEVLPAARRLYALAAGCFGVFFTAAAAVSIGCSRIPFYTVQPAVLAAFGGSVFNLAITTILYPPNYSTLPVYISDAYNDLNFGYSAAATIVGGTFIVAIMLLLEVLLNLGKRKRNADYT